MLVPMRAAFRASRRAASAAACVVVASLAPVGQARAAAAPPAESAPVNWELFRSLWLKDVPRATPDEPMLGAYNGQKAAAYLDDVAVEWARQNQCGTCHTTVAYLMAQPALQGLADHGAYQEVRAAAAAFAGDLAAKKTGISTIIVAATVAAFTVGDPAAGQGLPADTRALFDYLWATQERNGSWVVRADGLLPFLERDPRYLTLLVALALGYSPDRYLEEPAARAGLTRLEAYLRAHPPLNMHEKAVLLWASVRTPGLLDSARQADYSRALLQLQKSDGGWALPSLGQWPRHDGAPNDAAGPSDGYATALAALVLCESGARGSAPVRRATGWLREHQRLSGRWYTRSLFSDGFQNYLSNMGTAYAAMALHSCDAAAGSGANDR